MEDPNRIEKLILKYEKRGGKYGGGSYLENSQIRRKDHSLDFDKITKDKVRKLFGKSQIKDFYLKQIKNYIYQELNRYHSNSRRKKKDSKLPTLVGEDLDITIKAIADNVLRALISHLLRTGGPPSGEVGLQKSKHYIEMKITLMRTLSRELDNIENMNDYEKINRKCKWLLLKDNPEGFYDLDDVDRSSRDFNFKQIEHLFKLDGKRYKEQFYLGFPMSKKSINDENKNFEWYAEEADYNGARLAVRFVNSLNNKKKLLGLLGACTYVYAKKNYENNNHWITPVKSISKWAKIYGVDRKVFGDMVKLVESCGLL